MAVPALGTLSLRGLGREKVYDNYSSTSNLINVSLSNLATGTGYDATNSASTDKPNSSTPHSMSERYGYDHDAAGTTLYNFDGDISIFKTYSMILFNSEVRRNYRAYKRRFDL